MDEKQSAPVTDQFKRPLKDLRISVTDRCNFRCTYCMPKEIFGTDYPFLEKNLLLSFEEVTKVARLFAGLGVHKIRLTGGEPLMRRDLDKLVAMLAEIDGIDDIAMTTNASLLPAKAKRLKAAGLDRVTVSLDALDDETFGAINSMGFKVNQVLKGIQAAQDAGLGVKINMVVKRGMNEHEIVPMARYFQGTGIIVRYIEFMDVGNTNGWNLDDVISKASILDRLQEEMPIEPIEPNYFGEVASRYQNAETGDEIGIISSISAPFCPSCTRARLSADGRMYTCLFAANGTDLRGPLRNGVDDDELFAIMTNTWRNRSDQYSMERTEETVAARKKEKIEMSYIGG